jgi:DoxX-like family
MKTKNVSLWIMQGVLAAMFLLAGASKLVMSPEQMAAPGPIQFPVAFIRFIGVCELLGAIGMIVPWLTGIKPGLTPLAGAGLAVIMIGATVVNLVDGPRGLSALTVILGALAATVAYQRSAMLKAWPTSRGQSTPSGV